MDRLASCFHDVRRPELIEHKVVTLVSQRLFGDRPGYEDLNDHDELRRDPLMVIDDRASRAALIPASHNYSGFKGIAGPDLLARLREQALHYGADHSGNLRTDAYQRTSLESLYAAGDVVTDLHQLSVATGHAAVAATDIHNSLVRNLR